MGEWPKLVDWLVEALDDLGGSARIADVCRHVWEHHERELRESGDLFYTWQHDIREAVFHLRISGRIRGAKESPKGIWELA